MGKASPAYVPPYQTSLMQAQCKNQIAAQQQAQVFGNHVGYNTQQAYMRNSLGNLANAAPRPKPPPAPNYAEMVAEADWERKAREKMEQATEFADKAKKRADEMFEDLKDQWTAKDDSEA